MMNDEIVAIQDFASNDEIQDLICNSVNSNRTDDIPGKGHENDDVGGTKLEFAPIDNKITKFNPDLGGMLLKFDSSLPSSSSAFASSNNIMTQEAKGNDKTKSQVNLANRKKFKSTTCGDNEDLTSCNTKSEWINNQGDGTGTTNASAVVLLNPNSLSLEESVFSIDHLLEAILGKCDRQALLNSRLVSGRWAHFGSKVLQKVVNIRFVEPPHFCKAAEESNFLFKYDATECNIYDYDEDKAPEEQHEDRQCARKHRSLEHLINLMNNSAEFPSQSFSFSFSILNGYRVTASAQAFFNAHGPSIKKLKFDGVSYLDDLKQIIVVQAPNLEELSLINLNIWFQKSEEPRFKSNVKSVKQKIYLFDINETLEIGTRPILKKLTVFKCTAVIPETFIVRILEHSPNLVEVMFPQQSLHCLVRPVNRAHLIKKLVIYANQSTIEPLKIVSQHHQNKLAVQEIHFLSIVGADFDEGDLFSQVKDVMSRVLDSCSATCKKLVWIGSPCLKSFHFILPQMPNVTHLIFEYNEDIDTGLLIRLFAKGAKFAESFPKLSSLCIDSAYDMTNLPIQNIFGEEDPAPVPNVREVFLTFLPDENLLQRFQKMFPNSTFRTEFVLEVDEDYF